jgi:small subunit ribosomal protein S4
MSIYLHVFAKKQLKLGNLITIKKTSYYGFVLRSKQLLRFFYCFTDERHFANFYFLSLRLIKRRKLADSFVGLLESRLDVLLFRSYFSSSVLESRSLILNGFVFIKKKRSFFFNGVRNINFLLQPGSLV